MLPIPTEELTTLAATPLGQLALGVVGSAAWDGIKGSAAKIGSLFDRVAAQRPELNKAAEDAQANEDVEAARRIAQEATEAILIMANAGTIDIQGAEITALRSVDFDHMQGVIRASDFAVRSAGVISVGGADNATGSTHLEGGKSGSSLRTRGAGIDMGSGTSIKITGNAGIKIT
jgi:hypothetical protein